MITVGRYILRGQTIAFVCFVCCLLVSVVGATGTVGGAAPPKFTLMEHGPATVEKDATAYYYVKGRVDAAALATLTFDAKNCVLTDKAGKQYSDCWISIAGWSKGFSTEQYAPTAMKTLSVKQASGGNGKPSTDWNTSKVDGPKGKLIYEIPAGGYATFYFLWPVPNGAVGAACHLAEIGDVKLAK